MLMECVAIYFILWLKNLHAVFEKNDVGGFVDLGEERKKEILLSAVYLFHTL